METDTVTPSKESTEIRRSQLNSLNV